MEQTKTIFIPTEKLEAFKAIVKKCNKYFKLEYKLAPRTMEQFYHADKDGEVIWKFHDVYPCEISQITTNEWAIIAYIFDGVMIVADTSKEVKISEKHGTNVTICEECGHYMKNSYIIRNLKTNEEKQVGGECVKKFGITCKPQTFSSIISELRYFIGNNNDDKRKWRYDFYDKSACESKYIDDIIACAKAYFNTHKQWKSGYYDDCGDYIKSESSKELNELILSDTREIVPKGYITKVRTFIKDTLTAKGNQLSDFESAMLKMATDVYCPLNKAFYAYFMVKMYETELAKQIIKQNRPFTYENGDYVSFKAKLVKTDILNGIYGSYEVNEMITDNGVKLVRKGKINADKNGIVSGFTFIKYITNNNDIILDRVTKAPKKGLQIINID